MNKFNPQETEEKVPCNFLVEFPEELNLPSWTVKFAHKPKYAEDRWQPMTIVFNDPVKQSTSKALYDLIKFADVQRTYETKLPFLFVIQIKILDKVGEVVEHWKIQVKDIHNIDFGDLDYTNNVLNRAIEPKLTIIPKDCEYVSE